MKKIKGISLVLLCLLGIQSASFGAIDGTRGISASNSVAKLSLVKNENLTARKYILGPNDIISINVYNVPELKQEKVRVQPDGKIFLSPVGSLTVAGLTIEQLYNILTEKYGEFLQNPDLSINLDQGRPFIVYVTGAVVNPGSYELDTNLDKGVYAASKPEISIERKTPLLTNIIVAAGGLRHDADLENVEISNSVEGTKMNVNLLQLLEKGDTSQDLFLMAGDSVYIPKLSTPLAVTDERYKKFASASFSPHEIPVKVFGYVTKPGLVKLDSGQSLNLNSAITAAGGYMQDAAYAPNKVYISRADVSGKLVTRVVNPMSNDVTVMPNDIIYVPDKTRPLAGKVCDYIARIANPASSIAGSYNNWALMFNPGRQWGGR